MTEVTFILQEVKNNVVAVQFAFWNNGSRPIRFSEHVLAYGNSRKQEITIRLEDDKSKILGYSCPTQSRKEVVGLGLISKDPQNLLLKFDILDQGDGGICQIVYEGSQSAQIDIHGAIEEVPQGFNKESSQQIISSPMRRLASPRGILFIITLLYVAFVYILFVKISKMRDDEPSRSLVVLKIATIITMVVCSYFSLFADTVLGSKNLSIPAEIRPIIDLD